MSNAALLMGDEPLDTTLRRKRKAAKPAPSERAIQMAIKSRLALHGVVVMHIPNAGKRSAMAGFRLRQEGMVTGAPDLICVGDGGRVAWLEVKAAKGRLSDAQEACHAMLRRKGHYVAVVRDQDSAVEELRRAGLVK